MAKTEITVHVAELPEVKAALEAAAEKLRRVEALAVRADGRPWWTGHEVATAIRAVLAAVDGGGQS